MKRSPWLTIITLLTGMVAALLLAILFIVVNLNPPANDLRLLILFMSGSGGITVLLAYLLYRQGLLRWFSSLRWSLMMIVIITTVLIILNVWVTAQLMFISQHDLVLTMALLVFAGMTALIFGLFVANTITDRIQALSQAAEQLAQGKLDIRLDAVGSDELARLTQTFNWMVDNLQKIEHQKKMVEQTRRDLIAWVSHDLRTPLTSIRVMIEALADEVVTDPDTVSRYVHSSRSELQHLSRLIDDLFELAKLDAGHLDAHYDMSSLKDLISDVLSSISPRAERRQVRLIGSVGEDLDPVYMASDKIQRVLYNLIDNALQHTPTQGEVVIRACREVDQVRVEVHNTGSTISPDHVGYVFESFYRGDGSRVRDEDGRRGTGLGLAIARGFVEAHHGKIWVESRAEMGTTFSFTLPLRQPT
ncbi:MAG: HAMP domain-containing histidine kinase [Chloroflexi bacterium]|nr:HAMP domain-containing histidine kinase [Chloroflexota bacterium]